ncbi:MFS transporter, partial [Pseudomonas sp. BJa5]|nr:MFS transporter [Pseudomonas sp. BGr12]
FATVLFAPLMGLIVNAWGWEHVFIVMGELGILFSIAWMKLIYNPKEHPMIVAAELEHIDRNVGLVDMDKPKASGKSGP